MDEKKQKQFAHELKVLVAKHMKTEIDDMVEGLWADGHWSDLFEGEEEQLLKEHGLTEIEVDEENHDIYMESFSGALTDIKKVLTESIEEMQSYPHKIYEDGVCIAKFHFNAQTEAHDLWEQVCNSTDDLGAYFETIDPDGEFVTIKIMEDD
jgi:hypothetical protein